jgi:heme-degrading monooxygenase HmoA
MIVTIFRSRLRPENSAEYYDTVARMVEIAVKMPGYISHKVFSHEDGERVNIIEFADPDSQRAWATEARHLEAKKRGRAAFYAEYKLQVCEVVRESTFSASESAGTTHRARVE